MIPAPRQQTVAVIYGSGDPGTIELRRRYLDKGAVDFRDLRIREPDGGRPHLKALNERALRGELRTIPQVFLPDGTRIGDYEQALAHLDTLPDLPFGRRVA